MKAADISDDVFMAAVAATPPMSSGSCWRARWDVKVTLERMLGTELPEKLFLAKARKLGLKGKLMGCTECTCRGDYHTPRECKLHGCCCTPEMDWTGVPGYDPSWEGDVLPPRPPLQDVLTEAIRQLGLGQAAPTFSSVPWPP